MTTSGTGEGMPRAANLHSLVFNRVMTFIKHCVKVRA